MKTRDKWMLLIPIMCLVVAVWVANAAYRMDRVKLVAGPHDSALLQGAPAGESGTPVLPTLGMAESLFRDETESTAIVDDGTTAKTVGDFSVLAVEWATVGGSVTVSCGGTVSGANGTKSLILSLEGTSLTTTTLIASEVGDWHYTATIVNDGATTQKAISSLVLDGATTKADYATGAVTITGAADFLLQVDLAHTSDILTKENCVWFYKP